jgi:hypothetical protein
LSIRATTEYLTQERKESSGLGTSGIWRQEK